MPDGCTAATWPRTTLPAGSTTAPSTFTDSVSSPSTASSTWLVSELTPVVSFTASGVPSGTVYSRNFAAAGSVTGVFASMICTSEMFARGISFIAWDVLILTVCASFAASLPTTTPPSSFVT